MNAISDHVRVNALLYQFADGYLGKLGWMHSLDGTPRDAAGFVPYITYPALRQLRKIVRPDMRVFEHGCGASSLWWAGQVAEVVSVEHDRGWAESVAARQIPNLSVLVRERGAAGGDPALLEEFHAAAPDLPLSGEAAHDLMHGLTCDDFLAYAAEIAAHGAFDVVVVDGMARCLTAFLAPRFLRPGGFILFDNADRWQYNWAYRYLRQAGFYRLDFYGPGPVNRIEWCTSIFTRDLAAFAGNVERPQGDCDLGW